MLATSPKYLIVSETYSELLASVYHISAPSSSKSMLCSRITLLGCVNVDKSLNCILT